MIVLCSKPLLIIPSWMKNKLIVRSNLNNVKEKIKAVVTTKQIEVAQATVREIYMDEKIEKYILDLVFATRYPERYNLVFYQTSNQFRCFSPWKYQFGYCCQMPCLFKTPRLCHS